MRNGLQHASRGLLTPVGGNYELSPCRLPLLPHLMAGGALVDPIDRLSIHCWRGLLGGLFVPPSNAVEGHLVTDAYSAVDVEAGNNAIFDNMTRSGPA